MIKSVTYTDEGRIIPHTKQPEPLRITVLKNNFSKDPRVIDKRVAEINDDLESRVKGCENILERFSEAIESCEKLCREKKVAFRHYKKKECVNEDLIDVRIKICGLRYLNHLALKTLKNTKTEIIKNNSMDWNDRSQEKQRYELLAFQHSIFDSMWVSKTRSLREKGILSW